MIVTFEIVNVKREKCWRTDKFERFCFSFANSKKVTILSLLFFTPVARLHIKVI